MKQLSLAALIMFFWYSGYGQKIAIKGFLYHPPEGFTQKFRNDIRRMKDASVNTLILQKPIQDEVQLDYLASNAIKVITVFPYDHSVDPSIANGAYLEYVKNYKNHPAILMWGIGYASNYEPWCYDGDINIWYRKLNEYAEVLKKEDTLHKITTVFGGIPDKESVNAASGIDCWGLLVFRGDNLTTIINDWNAANSKPMYLISGVDSYDNRVGKEDRMLQANGINNMLLSVIAGSGYKCQGILLTMFADNHSLVKSTKQDTKGILTKSGNYAYDGISDVEYLGVVTRGRWKKKAFRVVKEKFKNS